VVAAPLGASFLGEMASLYLETTYTRLR
jgi:hypothetical protein